MLEREVVTHLNELTPRNVDSWRGWPEKVAVFFDEIKENNKSVFTTHSQILSTVYNMFHLRSERINLYYISTYLAFSLFSPPQREPTIFQWLEGDTPLRCEVFLYQFVIWKCFNLPLRSAVVISKKHLFTNVKKKRLSVQMLFIPSGKNSSKLRWRVDADFGIALHSCVYFSIFFFFDSSTYDEFHRPKLTAY